MTPGTYPSNSIPSGNVFVQDMIDRGPRLIWHRQTAAAGTTTGPLYAYFNTTAGASGKNITNLLQANRVPPPEAMMLMSLGFRFAVNMLPADTIAFIDAYYFELVIGRKIFIEGILDQYPAGCGLSGWAATNHATTALIQSTNNGDPSLLAQRRFNDWPRIIPANVYFEVDVKLGGTAVALAASVASTVVSPAYGGLNLRVDGDGLYDASVQ